MNKYIDLSDVLRDCRVVSSAPTRIDLGGGIDHRLILLICNRDNLSTFNFAIKLYTRVILESYKEGVVLISSLGGQEEINVSKPCFRSKFGLILAVCSFFRISGVKIKIETDYPPHSGLGGSGSLTVALIGAILEGLKLKGEKINSWDKNIVWLAHSIEDSLLKNTGLQDQASAFYGGINIWKWNYPDLKNVFDRERVEQYSCDLENNSLLIYSGLPHYVSCNGSKVVHSFLSRNDCLDFVNSVCENTQDFIRAIKCGNKERIKYALDREEQLRRKFLLYKVPLVADNVITRAREEGCGIKFVGGGGGGCLWAFGARESINNLRLYCSGQSSIRVLPIAIDYQGLMVYAEKN